jgi:hypothetical protein
MPVAKIGPNTIIPVIIFEYDIVELFFTSLFFCCNFISYFLFCTVHTPYLFKIKFLIPYKLPSNEIKLDNGIIKATFLYVILLH